MDTARSSAYWWKRVRTSTPIELLAGFYLLFNHLLPRVILTSAVRRNRELPILLALVSGLGSASITHALGLSPAIGAFLAGMLLAESPYATQIRADIGAVRTVLMTLFFSSFGKSFC